MVSEGEKNVVNKEFKGEARVGRVMKNFASISLKPEDLSSPVAFQMAISRLYESLMKVFESGGPETTYIAEVKITDDTGNQVSIAIDLGNSIPPFSSDKVKADVKVTLYED
ncbi:hypothetical protein [Caldisphaera sp.]|jgi:hypothetical protein|uniref:hypothetical protein n=1 Tax=Caldisphaera sp. TaxID=2060322 RepID=UPI0039799F2C